MANDNNDIVILDLDRPRELRFTHRVMKRYCAATGAKMTEIETSIENYDNMTLLLYEMLRADDPELTPERCDELLDLLPIGVVLEKGAEAIAAGFGTEAQQAAKEKQPHPMETAP